jgi:hypothetical protein
MRSLAEAAPSRDALSGAARLIHYASVRGWPPMLTGSRYLATNRAYGDPFVFHLTDRGFFSEVNCLLGAAVYGLLIRRRIIVNEDAFAAGPWGDYFASRLPREESPAMVAAVPPESVAASSSSKLFGQIRRRMQRWQRWRRPGFYPGIGVCFGFFRPARAIANALAQPASRDWQQHMPSEPFAALHIRRGDKIEGPAFPGQAEAVEAEGEAIPPERYVELVAAKAPRIKTLFVLTDDFSAVEDLRAVASGYRIVTLAEPAERGYRQPSFDLLPLETKRRQIRRLLVETEVAARSQIFVGGFKSNVARYVALTHDRPRNCFSVDGLAHWIPG